MLIFCFARYHVCCATAQAAYSLKWAALYVTNMQKLPLHLFWMWYPGILSRPLAAFGVSLRINGTTSAMPFLKRSGVNRALRIVMWCTGSFFLTIFPWGEQRIAKNSTGMRRMSVLLSASLYYKLKGITTMPSSNGDMAMSPCIHMLASVVLVE